MKLGSKARVAGFIGALLASGIMPLTFAQGQERNLDRESSVGKVFAGEFGDQDNPARFTLSQAAGESLDLTAMPVAGSDPYLKVYDAGSGALVAENDDSNGSLAANVRLYSEGARRLRIEVSGAGGSTDGARFDLVVRPSDYRPAPVREIQSGESFSGSIQSQDEQLFRIRAERGQQWEFSMVQAEGSNLDPLLAIYSGERPVGAPLGEDDDGGGDLNSLLKFTAPANGVYVVRASGVGSTAGGYTFSAGPVQVPQPVEVRNMGLDAAVSGSLDSRVRERLYRLDEQARAVLRDASGMLVVEMKRAGSDESDFDPVLEIGFETPLGFSVLRADDDSGGELDAKIEIDASSFTPEWLETLRIKAKSYGESEGDFQLTASIS